MAWSLATQFNVDNTIADQWFLYSHIFTKRWLIIHIESNDIPETWESVGYAIPAYLLNNDSLPGIDDSWVIGGDDRDNRYRLLPLKAQELVAPFEQGQAYRLYFRFVRYMRNATISIYENDQDPSYGNGGTGVVLWSDIQGDKFYDDLVGLPTFGWELDDINDTWATNSLINITHGLVDETNNPIKPELVKFTLICSTANNGYSVGDEVEAGLVYTSTYIGVQVFYDTTNIYLEVVNGFLIPNKTGTANNVSANPAQWNLRVKASRFTI
jgi:hypothetical protein